MAGFRRTARVFFCAALASLPAWAAEEYATVDIEQQEVPAVRVVSTDGAEYDAIAAPTDALVMRMSGDCQVLRHVVLARASGQAAQAETLSDVDISDLDESDHVLTPRTVRVPPSALPVSWPTAWRNKLIDACNDHLDSLLDRGSKRSQVLSKDWNIGAVVVDSIDAELYCSTPDQESRGDQGSWGIQTSTQAMATVICGRHIADDFAPTPKPRPIDDLTYGTHVIQANLVILPVATATECGINLSGMVETDAINVWVTLYYQNNQGGMTPWRAVKTDHSKTAFFNDFIEFSPDGSGGFIATPAGAPGPGSLIAPSSDKQFVGTYQMLGKHPLFHSNIANFGFDCPTRTGVTNFQSTPPPTGRP
jgi:hypothetical protein